MDEISVNKQGTDYVITVRVNKKVENLVEALREASKILQREVMRYESNSNWRFNR